MFSAQRAWWQQAIYWTIGSLQSEVFHGIYLRTNSQEMNLIRSMCSEMTYLE